MNKFSKRQRAVIRQIAKERGVSYSVAKFIYACLPRKVKEKIIPPAERVTIKFKIQK